MCIRDSCCCVCCVRVPVSVGLQRTDRRSLPSTNKCYRKNPGRRQRTPVVRRGGHWTVPRSIHVHLSAEYACSNILGALFAPKSPNESGKWPHKHDQNLFRMIIHTRSYHMVPGDSKQSTVYLPSPTNGNTRTYMTASTVRNIRCHPIAEIFIQEISAMRYLRVHSSVVWASEI